MGNVAISFIEVGMTLSDNVTTKRQETRERKRMMSLIPRYLRALRNFDTSITRLDLNRLGVDTHDIRLFSIPLISGHTRVTELYLEGNQIGLEGSTAIAKIIASARYLKDVSLANNPVGSVGIMSIASALEQNPCLERLDLSYCNIDDDGILMLAHALKHNTTLRYLNLDGNNITSVGIYALTKCIYDTSNMHSLWDSNHTLRSFFGPRPIHSRTFPETLTNKRLAQQLREILAMNRYYYSMPIYRHISARLVRKISSRIAAYKILRHYVKEDDTRTEYREFVEGMDEKLVPHIVGWLTNHADVSVIYRELKDMPWLLEKRKTAMSPKISTIEQQLLTTAIAVSTTIITSTTDIAVPVSPQRKRCFF